MILVKIFISAYEDIKKAAAIQIAIAMKNQNKEEVERLKKRNVWRYL